MDATNEDREILQSLINTKVIATDKEYDKETDSMIDKDIVVVIDSIINENVIGVHHQAEYSRELFPDCGIKLEFKYTEYLALDRETNRIIHRGQFPALLEKNNKEFTEKISKAYEKLDSSKQLFYIYRHYSPINKPIFTNTELIGITDDWSKADEIINNDTKNFVKNGTGFDSRIQKFTYSVTNGNKCMYTQGSK